MAFAVMEWNEQRETVFKDRYALKDINGAMLETDPSQMWDRVARAMSNSPEEYEQYYYILKNFKFVPSGRILSGAEAGQQVTYYNCFVIGVRSKEEGKGNDSRSGIMNTLDTMVEITARGGGVGINWSTLRPRGSYIRGVHGSSSGANSWMRGADGLADQIRQGGSRTAALMFMLEDWHPDILEFVNPTKRFERANFSVGISDRFMKALREDDDWTLVFPDTSHPLYDREWDGDIQGWVESGLPVNEYGSIRARDLWDAICQGAHTTGSPGVIFLERCNKRSNTWFTEKLIAMNPCGEQSLPAGGSCNLGSINLPTFWDPVRKEIKWSKLSKTIKIAVQFLDSVIDKSVDINQEIGDIQRGVRRVGLGTMGLADLLIMKGIRYGSAECIEFIDSLYSFIRDQAYLASTELASRLGSAPDLDVGKFLQGHFIRTLPNEVKVAIRSNGIRNMQLLTQAPTGTTSILAGVSSGIEPVFRASYTRKDATGEHKVLHPLFKGQCGPHLVTASQVSIEEHIRVQAAIQKYLDSSISKTVNLSHDSTVEDVSMAYHMAYDKGCKGTTIYRNGSLEDDVLSEEEVTCEACSI